MKVKDCMCNNVIWATPETTVHDCVKLMSEKHIGSIPICNTNQNVVGLVTDRDILLRAVACDKDIKNTKVSDIMTTNIWTCDVNNDVHHATVLMSENQVRRIPITQDNKIVGILSIGDLAKNDNINDMQISNTFENICNCNQKNAE